jgi:glycosyltransferase involved in cell wall biosynthesis
MALNNNWKIYLEKNPDLIHAGITTEQEVIQHYVDYGMYENRDFFLLKNFDWKLYLLKNLDLINAGITNEKDTIRHYLTSGIYEGRQSININFAEKRFFFLISHENTNTGAVNMLKNIEKLFIKHNINVIMWFLPELINFDVASYIIDFSFSYNMHSIAICNTLVCGDIAKKLSSRFIKTYIYIHEWVDTLFSNYNVDFLNSSIIPICVTNKSLENLKSRAPFIKNQIVIPYGISETFLEKRINKTCGIDFYKKNDGILISIIGTIDPRKNQQKFIDNVFYSLADKYPNLKLLLIGRPDFPLKIKESYNNSINILGEVTNPMPFINISDIIVSYSNNEVFPVNLLESMYCAKPIVSSNVGAVSDMIVDKYNGFLFNANDADACKLNICNLIDDADLRIHVGEIAKEHFLKNFEEKKAFSKFLTLV